MNQMNSGARRKRVPYIAAAALPLAISAALAQEVEEVTVTTQRVYPASELSAPATRESVDTAELLQQLPGANFNRNGSLTGIAQYRGLFGDRVNVSVNGLGTLSGGPNAMDAPLSYASPLLLKNLTIERGIASVSGSSESLGGHIDAEYDRGDHSLSENFTLSGNVRTRYEDNGNQSSTGLALIGANDSHKVALLAEDDQSDDLEFADGLITPSKLDRQYLDLSYAWRNDATEVMVWSSSLDTIDTGTPALPMDIGFIDTRINGISLDQQLDATRLEIAISRTEVDHVMDNFSLRTPPASPMGYRTNTARGSGSRWKAGTLTELERGELRFGIDGESSVHAARITNPNMAPFFIQNFADAERDLVGLYGQWNQPVGSYDIEAGIRFNRVSLDSGEVSFNIPPMNPMMTMMGMNAGMLAAAFNASDRSQDHDNTDVVFKIGRVVNPGRTIYIELAQKTRAPSYQEAFLWLPLQSTGGLADGRSYVGNPLLSSETSHEINLGTDWRSDNAWLMPQVFYKDIKNYIQGVPTTNATANMVAMMMTGMPALEFANTDAEIYGLDLSWGLKLSEQISLDGTMTWVRGKRTDIDDNLYRLAPLNGRVSLTLDRMNWSAALDLVAYAGQDDVASYNAEPTSAGYGIVNARFRWDATDSLELSASIENALDRTYRPHLGGINRVAAVDVLQGARLPGYGRSINVGLAYSW